MRKIERLQEILKKKKIDAALLINSTIKDPNILYFTDIELEYCFLIIAREGEAVFLVSPLEYEKVKKNTLIENVKQYKDPWKEINKLLKNKKIIAINENYVTIAGEKRIKKELKNKKFVALQEACKEVRMIKEKEEIECLKKAAEIGDKIFSELIEELKINRKRFCLEKDIAEYIDKKAAQYAEGHSFETIVASGKNASQPHYHPKKVIIQKGFCVLDFGVRYKNYISDMSRTIFFGIPTKEEKMTYEKVRKANEDAIKELKIGKKFKDIDKISRKTFDYPHSLGHGIGVEVHEAPSISLKSKERIEENMCFTIEPGLYVSEKYGIRIEDEIWMTKKGPKVLTKSSKELFLFE